MPRPPLQRTPTRAAFAEAALQEADQRVAQADRLYRAAVAQAQAAEAARRVTPLYPAAPALLSQRFLASCAARAEHHVHAVAKQRQRAEQLRDRAYLAGLDRVRVLEVLEAEPPPPPRLVALCGGILRYVHLPTLTMPPGPKAQRPDALAPEDVPWPVMRGNDWEGRLFLVVRYECRPQDGPATQGLVVLAQSTREAAGPWQLHNPHKLRPPGAPYPFTYSPLLPSMTGQGRIAGGRDAQLLLDALTELIADGAVGPYHLAAAASPSRR
jgi:hypothetical protein